MCAFQVSFILLVHICYVRNIPSIKGALKTVCSHSSVSGNSWSYIVISCTYRSYKELQSYSYPYRILCLFV